MDKEQRVEERLRLGRNHDLLPLSLPPRGLSRDMAATYIGISPSKFDEMVRQGKMPPPKRIDRRKLWDRKAIDAAFDQLQDDFAGQDNPWNDIK